MIIDRQKQQQFIKDELKAQTDAFKQKLETSALDLLLEKNEVFVGMFIKFMDNGEALFKFPVSRALPRKNSHYYCFTLPDVLKRYKDWGNLTYGDLIKKETGVPVFLGEKPLECVAKGAGEAFELFKDMSTRRSIYENLND